MTLEAYHTLVTYFSSLSSPWCQADDFILKGTKYTLCRNYWEEIIQRESKVRDLTCHCPRKKVWGGTHSCQQTSNLLYLLLLGSHLLPRTTSGLPGSRALQWSLHSSHSMAAMCPGRAGHSGRGFTAERHTVYNLKNRRVTALFNGFFSDQFKYQVLVLILLSSIWHMFNSVSLKQFALGF